MEEHFRKHIYCSRSFLEFLTTEYDKLYKVTKLNSAATIMALYQLITDPYIVLYLDEDLCEEMEESKRENTECHQERTWENLINKIDDNQHEGKLQLIKTKPIDLRSIRELVINDTDNQWNNSVFLVNDGEGVNPQKLSAELGILIVTPKTIKNIESLARDNGKAIAKEKGNWSKILTPNVPCNSIIIVDNYILNKIDSNEKGKFIKGNVEVNLRPIFDTLLPKNLDPAITFEVIIFTTLGNLEPDDRIKIVRSIIKDLRPNMKYNLTLYVCDKSCFHDRCILTNNLWISCGGGFDLFVYPGRATKQTTVSIMSTCLNISTPWLTNAISNLIHELKKTRTNIKAFGENGIDYKYSSYRIGNNKCRLID